MKKALLSKLRVCRYGRSLTGLLVAAALPLTTGTASAAALQISQSRGDTQLTCVPVADNTFELSFIHSVSLTPVEDLYQIRRQGQGLTILQTAERFTAHGQGLPSMAGEPDATAFEHKNGTFILQMQRPIRDLIVRTDQRFKNRLHTGQTTVNLNQWPDTGLRIKPVDHCD